MFMYQLCVSLILYYATCVWGSKNHYSCESRYIHKFIPFQTIISNMGWEPCELNCFMLMRRMCKIAERTYLWDKETNGQMAGGW